MTSYPPPDGTHAVGETAEAEPPAVSDRGKNKDYRRRIADLEAQLRQYWESLNQCRERLAENEQARNMLIANLTDMTQKLASDNHLAISLDRVSARIDHLDRSILELRSQLAVVEDLPALFQLVQRHEEDIRVRLTDATARRDDIGSEKYRSAADVWDRLMGLYSQRVRHLVNRLKATLPKDSIEPRRPTAELLAELMACLFPVEPGATADVDSLAAVLDRLRLSADERQRSPLLEIVEAAQAIHTSVKELGLSYVWTVDRNWVENHRDHVAFWSDCSEDDPPAFTVCPALALGARTIGYVTVFTSRRSILR